VVDDHGAGMSILLPEQASSGTGQGMRAHSDARFCGVWRPADGPSRAAHLLQNLASQCGRDFQHVLRDEMQEARFVHGHTPPSTLYLQTNMLITERQKLDPAAVGSRPLTRTALILRMGQSAGI